MDGARFDALARALGARPTRRGLLGGLTGLAAGLLGVRAGEAACGPDQVNRRGVCLCKTTGRPPGADGVCPCPNGLTRCGDACVALSRDVAHCGACGHACPTGANVAAMVCRQGACRIGSCVAGWASCDGTEASGCETDLGTAANCGACGNACPAEAPCCVEGICQAAPPPSLADCQGRCSTSFTPATVVVCGQPVACPPCADCVSLGCFGAVPLPDGPAGDSVYCVADEVDFISCVESCPDNSYLGVCHIGVDACYPVCLGD